MNNIERLYPIIQKMHELTRGELAALMRLKEQLEAMMKSHSDLVEVRSILIEHLKVETQEDEAEKLRGAIKLLNKVIEQIQSTMDSSMEVANEMLAMSGEMFAMSQLMSREAARMQSELADKLIEDDDD